MNGFVLLLKALADETRLAIISELRIQPCCVRSLAYKLNISSPAVSQHLRILREAGLVTGIKIGYYTHYCLDPIGWQRMQDMIGGFPTVEEARQSMEYVRKCRCSSGKHRNKAEERS